MLIKTLLLKRLLDFNFKLICTKKTLMFFVFLVMVWPKNAYESTLKKFCTYFKWEYRKVHMKRETELMHVCPVIIH